MTTFCKKCDPPYAICDFCAFYNFNPQWRKVGEFWRPVYVDEGFCYVDMMPRDPEEHCDCDEFYCFQIKKYEKGGKSC